MLTIYNSLTRRKEPFQPITPGHVRMYVCGMTVYDYCHLGHARVMLVFDMIARYLRARGFKVTYVRNITDIDDKIIQRARENGESVTELTERFIAAMREDTNALGLAEPDVEPRATEHIDAIIDLIQKLLDKRHAYIGAGGDVFFDIRSYPDYGRLSGKQLEELRAGARVEIQEDKRDPLDFVLWKSAKPDEPSWDSPWGPGRPGWHIECSAMSMRWLGDHFDIHGGGRDLQFPHHENEIAQSVCATGRPFVNVWMHNGFVRVADEKMSKSLGNFFTVREVLQHYRPEEVRYFILSSHYRSPVNYTDENLHSARASLTRLYTALRGMDTGNKPPDADFTGRFYAAMDDDFNTPEACAVLFDIAHAINREPGKETPRARSLGATLRQLGGVLGLLQEDPENYLKLGPTPAGADLPVIEIEQLIAQRAAARKRHDWQESDRIRNHLARHGVILEDGPAGTTWRRA